jgi:hypothetical protein
MSAPGGGVSSSRRAAPGAVGLRVRIRLAPAVSLRTIGSAVGEAGFGMRQNRRTKVLRWEMRRQSSLGKDRRRGLHGSACPF